MEKDLKVYKEKLTILKSNILVQKTIISNLDILSLGIQLMN